MARPSYATRLKSEIADVEAKIAALKKRLDELRVAERVLLTLDADSEAVEDDDWKDRTIADLIEIALIDEDRPLEAIEIFAKLYELGRQTSQNTVNTTLSRMKAQELLGNEDGKWFLIGAKRKKPQQ